MFLAIQIQCVDRCCNKHVRVNHKVMAVYMEVQPFIVQKRIEEMEKLNYQTPAPETMSAVEQPPILSTTTDVSSSELSPQLDSYAIPSIDLSTFQNIDSVLSSTVPQNSE